MRRQNLTKRFSAEDQLKLNPETLSVFLCGDIEKNDPNFNIAYTYIRNLEFYNVDSYIPAIDDATPHHHFIIKNIH